MANANTADDDDDEATEQSERDGTESAATKNYITPGGYQALKDELQQLLNVTRPEVVSIVAWAASNGDRSENADYHYGKKRLREIDRRIRFLTKRMESASIVDPRLQESTDQVFFGATVTYADRQGLAHTVTIVGVDESDLDNARISWISPVAKALLKARVGDTVTLRTPIGAERIEVLDVAYDVLQPNSKLV